MPSVASAEERKASYLPPLDQCFSGASKIISWAITADALADIVTASRSSTLRAFLTDELSFQALATCTRASRTPNGHAKTEFETRTAAINVTQQESGHHDIGEIKEDALWLAKHTGIDELTALRTSVLEWQDRPRRRVLGTFTQEENISLQWTTNPSSLRDTGASIGNKAIGQFSRHDHTRIQRGRRAHLIETWYDEQESMVAVRALLSRISLARGQPEKVIADEKSDVAHKQWLRDFDVRLCKAADPREEYVDSRLAVFQQTLGKLCKHARAVDEPNSTLSEELLVDWQSHTVRHLSNEALQLLRLAFILLHTSSQPPTPPIITEWFQSMGALGFFETLLGLSTIDESVCASMQSLISLVLVSLLDLDGSIASLDINAGEDEAPDCYALDSSCTEAISTSLALAVDGGHSSAALALVAWSSIGALLQANGADTNFDGIDRRDSHPSSPALTRSNPTTRKFGQAWRAYVSDLRSGEATIEHFMRAAIQGIDVYTHCIDLTTSAEELLGRRLTNSVTCTIIRRMSLTCLREVSRIAAYDALLVEAVVAVIKGTVTSPGSGNVKFPSIQASLIGDFKRTPILFRLFDEALARYPYELRPFLLLCQAILVPGVSCSDVVQRLRQIPSFTDRLPENFVSYEVTREQEFDNCFVIRESLPLFPSAPVDLPLANGRKQITAFASQDNITEFLIPQGTEGLALSKDHPPVISWSFQHSLISFLGRWLREAHQRGLWWTLPTDEVNVLSWDLLNLLSTLVDLAVSEGGASAAQEVLIEAGDALPHHTDVVTTVADIFEESLSTSLREDDTDLVLLMSACLTFLGKVARPMPGKVWPLLSRSGLLDSNDGEGRLLATVASSERVASAPALLHSVLDLFETMIDDIVVNAVARNVLHKTKSNRFGSSHDVDSGVPSKQMAKTITALTRLTLGLVRKATDWRFEVCAAQQAEVVAKAISILERLVWYTYGIGEDHPPAFLSPLHPAGALAVAFFLDGPQSCTNVSRLLTYMAPLATKNSLTMDAATLCAHESLVLRCCDFLNLLTELATKTPIADQTVELLSDAVPILVRTFAGHDRFKVNIAMVLAQLAHLVGNGQRRSPSLFASLGADVAQDAVVILSDLFDLDKSSELAEARWKLFSACIRSKQTWFASYLITGSVPSRSSRAIIKNSNGKSVVRTVLDIALDTLSLLEAISTSAAVAMLQFVKDALNHWPWTINRIYEHRQFLSGMAVLLDALQWEPSGRTPGHIQSLTYHTFAASLICEIFAMCFLGMRLVGNMAFIKEWAPRIPLLDQPGFKDPHYNKALHQRFKHNVENKFTGLRIEDFRRRLPAAEDFKRSYYDLDCAAEILDQQEMSTSTQISSGFVQEFQYADDNFCLVAAQKQLIGRWQLLCLELVKDADHVDKLPKKLAYVAHECLEANKASEEKDSVFSDLRSLRVGLATTILQKLVDMRYTAGGVQSLLSAAWDVMRAGKPDFEHAFAGDDLEYYRKCVKLLVLCIRPFTMDNLLKPSPNEAETQSSRATPIDNINIMLELAVEVVAKGFRSLASQLHDEPGSVLPADFVLLTNMLQVLLQVRGGEGTLLHSQLAIKLSEFNLGRYATALFSWSDRITLAELDPVYGEVSITFLAEMSVLPSLAETLATDGVLSQLNAADLMTYYQRPGGVGPFEEPSRMHKIWTRGILPLVLNVLIAVGAPFAAEAATFLNNYVPQLELATHALDSKGAPTTRDPTAGCITYNAACEAHTLALLAALLDRFRTTDDADIPELHWARAVVKDDVETWTQGTRAFLRERIVPTNEKEVTLTRTRPVGGDKSLCEVKSRLEEVVLKELKGALFVLSGG